MKRIRNIIILIVVFLLAFNLGNILRYFYPVEYMGYIKQYSIEYDVDPFLIMSIIKAESNFDMEAVSHKEAKGLMQITEPTAQWIAQQLEPEGFTGSDTTDPSVNIKMGTFYIDYLLKMYDGDIKNALCAYNAGFNNVDKWLKNGKYSKDGKTLNIIPYEETKRYVNKVLNNHMMYKFLYIIEF